MHLEAPNLSSVQPCHIQRAADHRLLAGPVGCRQTAAAAVLVDVGGTEEDCLSGTSCRAGAGACGGKEESSAGFTPHIAICAAAAERACRWAGQGRAAGQGSRTGQPEARRQASRLKVPLWASA